jgi:hypothetical protein
MQFLGNRDEIFQVAKFHKVIMSYCLTKRDKAANDLWLTVYNSQRWVVAFRQPDKR